MRFPTSALVAFTSQICSPGPPSQSPIFLRGQGSRSSWARRYPSSSPWWRAHLPCRSTCQAKSETRIWGNKRENSTGTFSPGRASTGDPEKARQTRTSENETHRKSRGSRYWAGIGRSENTGATLEPVVHGNKEVWVVGTPA